MEHPWAATINDVLRDESTTTSSSTASPVRDLYAERILAKRKVTNVDKDHPPVRRPLFRQNAQGELVQWTNDQMEIDRFIIRTEDDVIEIDDEINISATANRVGDNENILVPK